MENSQAVEGTSSGTSALDDGLEPADGCQACKRLQSWARTAWERGHRMGLFANRRTASEAMDALRREKAAHAETNSRLTEAMLKAEEERDLLRAVLLEAMRQMAKIDPKGAAKWLRENMGSNA